MQFERGYEMSIYDIIQEFKDAAYAHDVEAVQRASIAISKYDDGFTSMYGYRIIHAIVDHPDEQALKLMIQYRISINALDERKRTVLHLAVRKHRRQTIQLLLKYGANVNAKSVFGETPLMYMYNHKTPRVSHSFNVEIARLLISAKADVDAGDREIKTVLTRAIGNNDGDLARFLVVECKAQLNAPATWRRFTPLMYASTPANVTILRLLLTHHADASARDVDGHTALSHAASLVKSAHGHAMLTQAASSYGACIPALQLLLQDDVEMTTQDIKSALAITPSTPAQQLLNSAIRRHRQWQCITLLMMSIRATRKAGPFRYSILPLARSIMTLVG